MQEIIADIKQTLSLSGGEVFLRCKVHPGRAKTEVVEIREEEIDGVPEVTWVISLAAPPEKGKANKELTTYLAKLLGIPKTNSTILVGASSRLKLVKLYS